MCLYFQTDKASQVGLYRTRRREAKIARIHAISFSAEKRSTLGVLELRQDRRMFWRKIETMDGFDNSDDGEPPFMQGEISISEHESVWSRMLLNHCRLSFPHYLEKMLARLVRRTQRFIDKRVLHTIPGINREVILRLAITNYESALDWFCDNLSSLPNDNSTSRVRAEHRWSKIIPPT